MAPEKPGKPPKQRKTWKNAYLALRPEEGPSPEEVAAREEKIKQQEEKVARWEEEKKAGKGALKVRRAGGMLVLVQHRPFFVEISLLKNSCRRELSQLSAVSSS